MQENVNIPDSTITTNLSFRQLVLMNMQQLTNFPYIEKDFDALTDYELLCLVVKYLNDVIANQNEQNDSITRMYESFLALQTYVNNTKDTLEDAFNNLDNYVRNYFNNLDVQDEINNKLEQMAESGQLTDIIAQYLGLAGMIVYDTVADMVAAENLVNGSKCYTLGYYNVNDGGSATYKIRTKTNEDVEDHGSKIFIGENLVATICENNVNPIQFGAKCNGTDDALAIRNAINYLASIGGGNLDLLNNKEYTLDSSSSDSFIILKNKCNIIGSSTLKVKANHGDFRFMFSFDEDIDNIILKDFTIDENTTNNPVTANTGQEQYLRTIFRLLAYTHYIKNIIFDNLTINDCVGVWQYEFEGECNNVIINNCSINYNSTSSITYDRTSMYLGVKQGFITNCKLNGSSIANTGVEFHGQNIHFSDNIIENYTSGIFAVNNNTENYENIQYFVNSNSIITRGNPLTIWLSDENVDVNLINVCNNYLKTTTSGHGIKFYDVLGNNSSLENLKIYDNTIESSNSSANAFMIPSALSNFSFTINNIELYNNTFNGTFNTITNISSNADNTLNINNLVIYNNKINISNNIGTTFYYVLREGIKNIKYKNNIINYGGTVSYLCRSYGTADSVLNFIVENNELNVNMLPLELVAGDIYVTLIQKVKNVVFNNAAVGNVFPYLKCNNGSIIYDANVTVRKQSDKWNFSYNGTTLPTHIATFKGSTFQLSNHGNFIFGVASNDGFIADHSAGTNAVGDWVSYGLYVWESLTDNSISTPTSGTDFKYIGDKATFQSLS